VAVGDDGGSGGDDGSDGAIADAPTGGPEAGEAGPVPGGCDGGAGCVVVPPGWTFVAFAPSQATPCPAGYAAPTGATSDLVEGQDTSTACTCGSCTVTGQPSCASGTVGVYYDYVSSSPGAG